MNNDWKKKLKLMDIIVRLGNYMHTKYGKEVILPDEIIADIFDLVDESECEVCSPGKDKVIPVDNVLNPHCADCGRKISLIGDCFKTLYKPTECEDGYRVCYTSPELRKTVCSEKIVFKPKKIDKMKAITDDSSIMKNRYKINEIIDHLNKVSKVRE